MESTQPPSPFEWPSGLTSEEKELAKDSLVSSYQDLLAELRADPRFQGRTYRSLQKRAAQIWKAMILYRKHCLEKWSEKHRESCWGCREDQPNQMAHMDPGGCLHFLSDHPYEQE